MSKNKLLKYGEIHIQNRNFYTSRKRIDLKLKIYYCQVNILLGKLF